MKKLKTLTATFVTLILAMALARSSITAQTSDEMQTFFSVKHVGISIQLNATRETVPSANITINLWINCTADDVYVYYLNLSVYGYRHFRYGLEKTTLLFTSPIKEQSLVYHNASQYNYTIFIPADVWDLTYAELYLKYEIAGFLYNYEEARPITTVKNVLWEELEEKLESLNATYQQLNSTYCQLNNTYWQLNSTFELLNQTYWELLQDYTALQGSVNELDSTRTVVTILAITTVFFVVTTIYMMMRKPKQYW